jgi:hypothetical protein
VRRPAGAGFQGHTPGKLKNWKTDPAEGNPATLAARISDFQFLTFHAAPPNLLHQMLAARCTSGLTIISLFWTHLILLEIISFRKDL